MTILRADLRVGRRAQLTISFRVTWRPSPMMSVGTMPPRTPPPNVYAEGLHLDPVVYIIGSIINLRPAWMTGSCTPAESRSHTSALRTPTILLRRLTVHADPVASQYHSVASAPGAMGALKEMMKTIVIGLG